MFALEGENDVEEGGEEQNLRISMVCVVGEAFILRRYAYIPSCHT